LSEKALQFTVEGWTEKECLMLTLDS